MSAKTGHNSAIDFLNLDNSLKLEGYGHVKVSVMVEMREESKMVEC